MTAKLPKCIEKFNAKHTDKFSVGNFQELYINGEPTHYSATGINTIKALEDVWKSYLSDK